MVAELSFRKDNVGSTKEVHHIFPAFEELLHSRPVTATLLAIGHADYLTAEKTYCAFLQLLPASSALPSIVELHKSLEVSRQLYKVERIIGRQKMQI